MKEQEKETHISSVIIGSGSFIPSRRITNDDFLGNSFYDNNGRKLVKPGSEIIKKFSEITGILERRYVDNDIVTSDIAHKAAKNALDSSGIDPETLDQIIVAHNFGDIKEENRRSEFVPALASRVKNKLNIKNSNTVCYDLPFGCAGWLQGVIQADIYLGALAARRVMIIGSETLSRICDPHDRDSMIYSDGAGAIILEGREVSKPSGILSHSSHTYTKDQTYTLRMDNSNNPDYPMDNIFLKMNGHSLYEFALKKVPEVIKESIEKAGLLLNQIHKVLLHQANFKMLNSILTRLFGLYDIDKVPENILPTTIQWLGNSSVATLPTLYDLFSKDKLQDHKIKSGGYLVFASVGAGVNINSMVYRVP